MDKIYKSDPEDVLVDVSGLSDILDTEPSGGGENPPPFEFKEEQEQTTQEEGKEETEDEQTFGFNAEDLLEESDFLIDLYDILVGLAGGFISGTLEFEKYCISKKRKKVLAKKLAVILPSTLKKIPPGWMFLIYLLVSTGAALTPAVMDRMAAKRKEREAKAEQNKAAAEVQRTKRNQAAQTAEEVPFEEVSENPQQNHRPTHEQPRGDGQ